MSNNTLLKTNKCMKIFFLHISSLEYSIFSLFSLLGSRSLILKHVLSHWAARLVSPFPHFIFSFFLHLKLFFLNNARHTHYPRFAHSGACQYCGLLSLDFYARLLRGTTIMKLPYPIINRIF